jgi:hypothetical protein
VPTCTVVDSGLLVRSLGQDELPNAPSILLQYTAVDRTVLDAVRRLAICQVHWTAQGDEQHLWLKLESEDLFGLTLPDYAARPAAHFWYLQIVLQQELYWHCRTLQIDHEGEVLHDTGLHCRPSLDCFLGSYSATVH